MSESFQHAATESIETFSATMHTNLTARAKPDPQQQTHRLSPAIRDVMQDRRPHEYDITNRARHLWSLGVFTKDRQGRLLVFQGTI
jgi:hypothetical protein